MNAEVRELFHEVAGLPTAYRLDRYAARQASTAVRAELESLLEFDRTASEGFGAAVGAVAGRLLAGEGPVSTGDHCGPYRLIRLLGNGGMGAVYLAERADGEIEHQVAIKFVRAGAGLPSFHGRFLRERQILAGLNHPGIARLLDVGHSAGIPYLAMEYVDGARIDEYALGLDLRGVLALFVRVASAVAYAHRNLVIHRDLKPSNILVDRAGQPKLLDFGIAKLAAAPEVTMTMDCAMTPEYASPEQMRGEAQATTTDIFSLGAVLYRLLTGRSPRAQGAPAGGELPRDLTAIVSKAMREEPEERYASVDLLIADIEAYLEHRPVEARRGNMLYTARKFVRRRWLPMAAAVLAVAGLGGGLIAAGRERAIAERRFQQVRQLSKQFLELDAEIRSLPGSTKARNRIVTGAVQYLEGLAAEKDPDLALEAGAAYLQVARVQGVPGNSTLGQFKEASKSLSRAETFAEVALASPSFAKRRSALLLSAEVASGVMILAESEGRNEDSLAAGRRVAARLEEWAEAGPAPAESVTAAGLYANLAHNHSNLHRMETAVRFARRSIEIARPTGDKRLLTRSLSVFANTARFSGDLDGALEAAHESRVLAEQFANLDHAGHVLTLCGSLWREALILGELNNINLDRAPESIPLLERHLDLAESLARKDPHDYSSRSYVSMAGRELGDILRESDPRRAIAVYGHALRRIREAAQNAKTLEDEVWLLTGLSYALRHLGRNAEAEQRVNEAMAILARKKVYPAATVTMGDSADPALRALADHYAATGRVAEAIETYERLREKIAASKPEPHRDLRHANGLSRLYRDLESLHRRAGHAEAADALRRERVALWRHWERKQPDNPFVRRQLSEAAQAAFARLKM